MFEVVYLEDIDKTEVFFDGNLIIDDIGKVDKKSILSDLKTYVQISLNRTKEKMDNFSQDSLLSFSELLSDYKEIIDILKALKAENI